MCKILSDPVAYRSLLSVMDEPKMVAQICKENKTPLSSTYNIIKKLQKAGLVYVHSYTSTELRRVALYRSRVKSINIRIERHGGKLDVRRAG